MAGSAYHEAVWTGVPADAAPEDFQRRRDFLLEHVAAGLMVLDVGCGRGEFSVALAGAGAKPIAVDLAEQALRSARARCPGLDARLWACGEPLPLADAEVDLIWAGEVLEHVLDTQAFVSELRRVLSPGGRLLVTTPHHGRLRVLWLGLRASAFDEHFDPRADHLRFYSARSLRALLAEMGFEAIEIAAVGALPGLRRSLHCVARRGRW